MQSFASVNDTQERFDLRVLQGEDGQPMDDCLEVGKCLWDLPPRPSDEPSIDVTLSVDASGMVHVEAKDRVSGKTTDTSVSFYGNNPKPGK